MPDLDRAVPADAPALTALVHASSAYAGAYASILDGYSVTPEYVAAHHVFLARSPAGPLGFAALAGAELDLLFVADAAQGTGLGARLVARVLDEARALGLPAVRVVAHPPAAGFYERMGARRTGTVPPRPPRVTWERPELMFGL
ncbi:GNAT family N-acetyltransferase [Amycolatopsis rhabdoformis]|uniref:GNAT family N-acetyltransferase n=1 Tax=Amycolatopsis rhabdoformis TaxID=1448059 RepID=A0ABZ1HWJ0_9PSEU|nr:GNAT family N-acetyltransferase [Amycolatopsis rhabdoformis]WSE25971.1 GNAT family N-acetyltransferase [Amycolatopsis rhabdoformis]